MHEGFALALGIDPWKDLLLLKCLPLISNCSVLVVLLWPCQVNTCTLIYRGISSNMNAAHSQWQYSIGSSTVQYYLAGSIEQLQFPSIQSVIYPVFASQHASIFCHSDTGVLCCAYVCPLAVLMHPLTLSASKPVYYLHRCLSR